MKAPVTENRIIGGREAFENGHPWQVEIVNKSGSHLCGGSLITRRHILTAAHCLHDEDFDVVRDPSLVAVVLGTHNSDSKKGLKISITKAEAYRGITWKELQKGADAAILTLKKRVQFTQQVVPVCMPTLMDDETYEDEQATITGWGSVRQDIKYEIEDRRKKRSIDRMSEETTGLREAQVKLISNKKCKEMVEVEELDGRLHVGPMQLCTYNPDADACQGDSGGPITLQESGHSTQVGIVSKGRGCADPRWPSVNTRLTKILHWVIKATSGETLWNSSCERL